MVVMVVVFIVVVFTVVVSGMQKQHIILHFMCDSPSRDINQSDSNVFRDFTAFLSGSHSYLPME